MGKDKFRRFQENLTFSCLVQPDFEDVFRCDHPLKGRWHEDHFRNNNPIVLELGCGRGEYTVALARRMPDVNFIGVDIKGARMWRGAKTATEEGLANAAFLRTRIEFISSLFGPGEVAGLWITFPDPQLKKNRVKKRLTAPSFLEAYAGFLAPGAPIHLKTDSRHLHDYTLAVAAHNGLEVQQASADIYGQGVADEILSVKTTYETRFLTEGLPITYMRFTLGCRTQFDAPDFAPDQELE
jgi:tRNA (guanine-N7-)-methyltransferase